MAITPVGKRLIVEPIVEAKSQFIMTSPDSPQKGTVVSVGKKLDPAIQVGMTVSFARYVGTEVKDGTRMLLILDEKDILSYQA